MTLNNKQLRLLTEALIHSNWIENEYSLTGHEDAIKAFRNIDGLTISIKMILRIHRNLLWRLNPKIAGKFRTCAVSVGGRYCPALTQRMPMEELMESWCLDYPEMLSSFKDKYEFIKESHIVFEKLHPFEDGNGRVGRILMNVMAIKAGLDPIVIKVEDKLDYYKWFK